MEVIVVYVELTAVAHTCEVVLCRSLDGYFEWKSVH